MHAPDAQIGSTIHGPILCKACFPDASLPGCTLETDGWRIDNNPGYWGAADPEVLVLGFSKGANQRATLPFDEIGFAKARSNLKEILVALELLDEAHAIDRCFTAGSARLGFASVVRCGLGKEIEPGRYATSGDVIRSAIVVGSPVRRFFDACTERFLGDLPRRVRLVVFLGLDETYVEALFERMKKLHPSIVRKSDLVYGTEAVRFVHVIHPSPLATNHRQRWLSDDNSRLAGKRREVAAALGVYNVPAASARTVSPATARAEVRSIGRSVEYAAAKGDDLATMVLDTMRRGTLAAKVIGNQRTDDDDVKKVLRIRRADGEEFAIQRQGESYSVWSSVPPCADTRLAKPAEEYTPARTRHSNLGCMPKLRGPRKDGMPGVRAWKLHFYTLAEALAFIA